MRKYRVDACKVSRSIRLAVTLVVLFVFNVLVYYSFDITRVPVAYANPDVASFYPSDYNLYGSTQYLSGSVTDLQSDNDAYMSFRSYGSTSSANNPITNMNFTSDSSGWTYTEVDAKGYCSDGGWQSSGGNTLGSGGGCHRVIYNDVSSQQPGGSVTDIMRITYSFTTPSTSWYSQKASFAWKYSLDSGSYTTQTLTVKATLLDAADVVLETLYSTTTMQTSWQYQTNLAIVSALLTSTTYKLQLEFSIVNGGAGNKANIFQVSIYWDDAGVKFTYYSEYTMEVEFTGTSNTQTWTQLVWTVDSSFTTASVTTTLQLYNYDSGQYSPSGDGYMTDTIGTSDVTKTQTITTNPTYFRNLTGGWRMKIKGVKSIGTQFDWNGDLVKYEVTWTVPGYALNLRVRDWDLTDNIQGAIVYKDSDTKTSDSNGWANWTAVSGTVQIKVKYYGFWVNGTFSVTMNSDKTIDVQCKLYDVTVKVQEEQHNAYLVSANVTVFNASSTSENKIKSGITGNNGQVSLTNLPNNTLVFTQYGGSSYTIVIGNATQTVSSENQSITLTSNQNYASTSSPYSIIALLGLIIPLKRRSQLDISRENKVKKSKRKWKRE